MPQRSWIDTGFALANWEIRPRHGTLLRRDGQRSEPVRIEPRVMAVLVCLARHVGEVVTRDELCTEVWGGRVVSDEALSRCISLLRHVLDDNSREPRFIRTIARIGYTLVPIPEPLSPESANASLPPAISAPPATENVAATRSSSLDVSWPARLWLSRVRPPVLVGVGCIGLLGVLALVYFFRTLHSAADATPPPLTRLLVLPLRYSRGEELRPRRRCRGY